MATLTRFASFELCSQSRELRKHGIRIRVPAQSFEILLMLVERRGEVVTREEIRSRLWSDGTVVDFDTGMNSAVKRLRDALGETASCPRFIETLPRIGYRLLTPVEAVETPSEAPAETAQRRNISGQRMWMSATVILLALVSVAIMGSRWHTVGRSRPIRAIAVLPLVSPDKAQEYLADGIMDEVIAAVSQLQAIRVISRTSVLRYRKSDMSVPQIARELDVDAVVEGVVQRSGDRVRIAMQLTDAANNRRIWTGAYEREMKDVWSVPAEAAQTIAAEIRAQLSPPEPARRSRTVHPEAYEAYLKARYLLRNGAGFAKAAGYFREAIQKDPNFALALADFALREATQLQNEDAPLNESVTSKIRKALELDDRLAEAHVSLGFVELHWNWNWQKADAAFRRAVELDPSSSEAQTNYAIYHCLLGHSEEGLQRLELVRRLDPFSRTTNGALGHWLQRSGRNAEALEVLQKSIDLGVVSALGYSALATIHQEAGNPEAAWSAYCKWSAQRSDLRAADESDRALFLKGGMEAIWRERARERLAVLKDRAKRERVSPRDFAAAYAELGETEEAFRWLGTAFQQRCPRLIWLKAGWEWDRLRSDPRYQDLLRKMNFPQ